MVDAEGCYINFMLLENMEPHIDRDFVLRRRTVWHMSMTMGLIDNLDELHVQHHNCSCHKLRGRGILASVRCLHMR